MHIVLLTYVNCAVFLQVLEKCVKCLEKVQTAIFNSFLSDSECVEVCML